MIHSIPLSATDTQYQRITIFFTPNESESESESVNSFEMAIQLQWQRRNFGHPCNSAAEFHHLHSDDHRLQPVDGMSTQSVQPQNNNASSMSEMSTDQIDRFLRLQSERFRFLLQYRRNQQFGVLLRQIEARTRVLFQQKDEEIAVAKRRRIDLEQLLTRFQMENQERMRSVQENQAKVASLSHALDQIRDRRSSCENDAESNNNRIGEDDAIDCGNKRIKMKTMICRICNSRISCMLFLPCRHLCSCKSCEIDLDSCPVCNTTKKASIEAVIF